MRALWIAMTLLLAGCNVPPIQPSEVVIPPTLVNRLDKKSTLKEELAVGAVQIRLSSDQFYYTTIAAEPTKVALSQALASAGLLSGDAATYRLDAALVKIERPFALFEATVFLTFDYTLTRQSSDDAVWQQSITVGGQATLADQWDAPLRQRMAVSRALSENFVHVIRALHQLTPNDLK